MCTAQFLVLHSSCSSTGNCSAQLQKLLSACSHGVASGCAINFVPYAATFRLEQTRAVEISGITGLALEGNGAQILLRGNSPFIRVYNCSEIFIKNLTLIADRSPFTLGTVAESLNGKVTLKVDTARYPLHDEWTHEVVAMHEIDGIHLTPKIDGLDWIFKPNGGFPWERILLKVLAKPRSNNSSMTRVSFVDQGFGLVPGTAVVLRHTIEFSRPRLDSIVLQTSRNVSLIDLTIHHSPGMAVLAHDCTDLHFERIVNKPSSDSTPLAGNADAIHIASCRGHVVVRDCVADRQGDDGINIHSQYGVVTSVASRNCSGQHSVQLQVGPHMNADNTSWGNIFARLALCVVMH